ncbi:MAG: C-GCAxxG-C-C family protein [Bacillota bacterium]|nr:C-GCAxxG-C-C family protein [Bacillota bacterium]
MARMPASRCVKWALAEFDRGYCCAEAVLMAGAKGLGLTSKLIPKVASGFCGGVSRTRSVCGAVSGAVIVLGLKYGRTSLEDDRSALISKVQALMAEFRKEFGSENCFDLTGLDFNTPEGREKYRQEVHTQCRRYVEFCLRRALELSEN